MRSGSQRSEGRRASGRGTLRVVLSALMFASIVAGCSEELGPEAFATGRVEGSIAVEGRPLGSGWVEFQPSEGTVGNLRSARIGPDGAFAVDGVAAGNVAVGLANVRVPSAARAFGPSDLALFQTGQTPIRRRIVAGSTTRVDVDLAAEARSYRKRMQDSSRSTTEPGG